MILRPRSSTSGDPALGDLQSTSRPSIISTFRIPARERHRPSLPSTAREPALSGRNLFTACRDARPVASVWIERAEVSPAGQTRTTQIGKREYEDHTSRVQMFAAPDTIEARANALFRPLAEQNFLAGTSRDGFAAGANAIHFAREGNGRTNRLLLSAMAANAGHTLAFDVINPRTDDRGQCRRS